MQKPHHLQCIALLGDPHCEQLCHRLQEKITMKPPVGRANRAGLEVFTRCWPSPSVLQQCFTSSTLSRLLCISLFTLALLLQVISDVSARRSGKRCSPSSCNHHYLSFFLPVPYFPYFYLLHTQFLFYPLPFDRALKCKFMCIVHPFFLSF